MQGGEISALGSNSKLTSLELNQKDENVELTASPHQPFKLS